MMKKILSLLLCALMTLALAQVTVAEGEPFEITVMAPFYNNVEPAAESQKLSYIEETLNVKFNTTWAPAGEYTTKFNIAMASTEQPMVFVINSGTTSNANYIEMCVAGAFWDLTDKIQANEALRTKLTSPAALQATAIGGRNYLFPLITSATRLGVLYRQDWAEKLGLEAPDTLEKFKAMIEAFATKDPDGNGLNDTIGFAYCDDDDEELAYAGFDLINAWMGGPIGWGLTGDDKLMPYFYFDTYFDTLDLFKWMYDNNYMNADFAINTDKHGPMRTGVTGMMATSATAVTSSDYDELKNIHPDYKLATQQELYDVNGKRFASSTLSTTSLGGILISKYAVKDEATLDKILGVYADLYTGEMEKFMDLGVEGLSYLKNEDGSIKTEAQMIELLGQEGFNAFRTAASLDTEPANIFPRKILPADWGQEISPTQRITMKAIENEPYAVADLSMGYMDAETMSMQADIATMISDARVQYMMGKIDKDGFIAARNAWFEAGGETIIASVNAAYQAGK